jgi:hypothetical protein
VPTGGFDASTGWAGMANPAERRLILVAGTLNSAVAFRSSSPMASRLTELRGADFDESGHKKGPAVTGPSLGH